MAGARGGGGGEAEEGRGREIGGGGGREERERGGDGEEGLKAREFKGALSPSLFSSEIEAKCIPAVFRGCVKEWAAITKWNPSKGGLDYLQGLVGSCVVEAMVSMSGPVFYGDLKGHERVCLPFSSFLSHCKRSHTVIEGGGMCSDHSNEQGEGKVVTNLDESCAGLGELPAHIYLAQVPVLNSDKEISPIQALQVDFEKPAILEFKSLSATNFWMNNTFSRSSGHYDPHHNLLCIVTGRKQVCLWPPSATPFLYPMPLHGESSNHSAVDIEHPDLSIHPRAKFSSNSSHKVSLSAGDALFIPEGWFHQVDSDDLTIAINFWWQSDIMSAMVEHMDAFYLRIILRRLMDKEMERVLNQSFADSPKYVEKPYEQTHNEKQEGTSALYEPEEPEPVTSVSRGTNLHTDHNVYDGHTSQKDQTVGIPFGQLEPEASHILCQLISLVHENVSLSGQDGLVYSDNLQSRTTDLVGETQSESTPMVNSVRDFFYVENDPVACILWSVEPSGLRKILQVMAKSFPRTLEALVLHMLSPAGAEILTQKFDEMDKKTTKEEQYVKVPFAVHCIDTLLSLNEFYSLLYGIFDDRSAVMDAILNRKEAFGFQVLRNVLDQHLGVICDRPEESSQRR
ncbi:lysine-specific demethylase JMJ31 isoform X2 [Nymphaea colorata]|uniref:lysine-specific demethylase JMJ31 isoform X2 n=1 Tax=Nymphaea colorata TaxID=210225 RepID=UPI00129ECB14|nr:lysine-specific demethylase JMJ31 isoform X2 [Nymphaea colorata]